MDYEGFILHQMEKKLSPATISTYGEILKVFHKWLAKSETCPPCVSRIKSNSKKSNIYSILHDLAARGLIQRTGFKPVGYFATNPTKDYANHLKSVVSKLESGKTKIDALLQNSSSLSGELYLVKKDGGQQRLMEKKNRQVIHDGKRLRALRKAIDQQLLEAEDGKARGWAVYR